VLGNTSLPAFARLFCATLCCHWGCVLMATIADDVRLNSLTSGWSIHSVPRSVSDVAPANNTLPICVVHLSFLLLLLCCCSALLLVLLPFLLCSGKIVATDGLPQLWFVLLSALW
jgi:hypothetical protein